MYRVMYRPLPWDDNASPKPWAEAIRCGRHETMNGAIQALLNMDREEIRNGQNLTGGNEYEIVAFDPDMCARCEKRPHSLNDASRLCWECRVQYSLDNPDPGTVSDVVTHVLTALAKGETLPKLSEDTVKRLMEPWDDEHPNLADHFPS